MTKILAIDDDEVICKAIRMILEIEGYSVDEAFSGEDVEQHRTPERRLTCRCKVRPNVDFAIIIFESLNKPNLLAGIY